MSLPLPQPADLALTRLARNFIGLDRVDPVLGGGGMRRRVYLDTTATALIPRAVHDGLGAYYQAASANSHTRAHRAGHATTEAIEATRDRVGRFVGYDPAEDVVLLPGNGATGAINFLARALFAPELRLVLKRFRDERAADVLRELLREAVPEVAEGLDELLRRPIVVTTRMEHHSNILPWVEAVGRHNLRVIGVTADGRLDLDELARVLEAEGSRVRLLAVTGASNVTGVLNPVHELARMAHAVGARILVDAAQLAPHRPLDLHPHGMPADARLDFVALSGHKLYAPGSRGVLAGSFAPFERRACIGDVGGGMVEYVSTEDFQVKDEITAREEAGTPNIPGTLSLGMVACLLEQVGMDAVAAAEEALTAYAMDRLRSVPGLHLYGPEDPAARVGVFSFALAGVPYGLVAAYLDDYHNIAVRDGCFCAHPYVKELLKVGPGEERDYLTSLAAGDRRTVPGMVRASLGLYSTRDDMDALTAALSELARDRDRIIKRYRQAVDGSFTHEAAAGARHGAAAEALFSLDVACACLK
ncbi:MAG: aminotransferase class V-fold PLP-dependent enzyme [Deltaproteobacteria bacterium]|nr:aminotransferase class V-fold PLP-dependent enzyme [Deltaproteobacteria bacterium]